MSQGNAPRVSVIIAAYNRAALLRLTVESVLAQTYPNLEIIVIDDGSTDDTADVMAQYAGRIVYIRQDNQGGSIASNEGFRIASGEYINFLDHDDLFMPTKIERQAQILDSRPEIGLVHCGYFEIDKDGLFLERICPLPEGDLKELACWDPIWSGAPLIRRQCLEQTGLFDDDVWTSDWDLWLRIAQAGFRFACVQEPLGARRILLGSEASNIDKMAEGTLATLDKFYADPHLPAEVVALRDRAYSGQYFWLSCKYYAAGRWPEGQQNLAKALALRPQLLEDPQLIYEQALNPRQLDPVKFITGFLDHLPAGAESLRRYREPLLHQVYAIPALRSYRVGQMPEAKRQLAEAVTLFPTMLDQPGDFAKSVFRFAMKAPTGTPRSFVEVVFRNLPDKAQPLAQVRSRVLGEVNIGCAFQDYTSGQWLSTIRSVLIGLSYDLSPLQNRGVVSIFLKSVVKWLGEVFGRTSSAADAKSRAPAHSASSP